MGCSAIVSPSIVDVPQYLPERSSSALDAERHQIRGYTRHISELNNGNVVIVPNQGALTYSLAQSFALPVAQRIRTITI